MLEKISLWVTLFATFQNYFSSVSVSALMPEPPDESGSLSGAVHAAVARMNGHYSVRDVIAEMERAGYKFQAKNPRSAATTVLNKLVQRKRIALVSEGKGGQPSVYSNKT